ncbi:MAG TPA: hypothetical protein VK601_12525, partial [Kofleriaceae bacterium]|nr:hypothetical protein [Kofleriaceae bacterium]
DSDPSQVWISRFDPASETWSTNVLLPYTSVAGPPAIAAFNGVLRFIGTTPGTFHMWTATMTASESFSAMTSLPGHDSASRPSAAVFLGQLYFVHRHGQTGNLVVGSFTGSSWTAPQFIPAAGGAAISGLEVGLAADAGFLHLVHRRTTTNNVWWTYFDGCGWSTELTIGTLASSYGPSLTQGGPGLVMTVASDVTWNGIIESRAVNLVKYTHPWSPFPPQPPICGVILQ